MLTVYKYQFTVDLLSLLAIGASKLALLAFHLRITPQPRQRFTCYGLMGICAAWTVAAMVVVGIRCGNYHGGSSTGGSRCIDYVCPNDGAELLNQADQDFQADEMDRYRSR